MKFYPEQPDEHPMWDAMRAGLAALPDYDVGQMIAEAKVRLHDANTQGEERWTLRGIALLCVIEMCHRKGHREPATQQDFDDIFEVLEGEFAEHAKKK